MLLCLSSVGCNLHEPVGVELTYAVDDDESPPNKVDMQKVINALQRRVARFGTAELVAGRVKIGVFGSDQKNVDRVKELISRAGVLEFRILADRGFDEKVIDLASNEQFVDKRDVRRRQNDEFPVAQWCPVEKALADLLKSEKRFVARTTKLGRTEALVVVDAYHVTGDDFSEVYPATDGTGQSYVAFGLTVDGARRMRRLTLENLPVDGDSTKLRLMGIILDGEMQSAPAIRSVIEDRAQITGKFTDQQVSDLALVLGAGSLPVHLELVDQIVVEGR